MLTTHLNRITLAILLCLSFQLFSQSNDVEALLKRMTLDEKIGQMVQINDFNGEISDDLKEKLRTGKIGSMLNEVVPEASAEIQRIAREESRLGIPIIMARDVIHGFRTIFPIPLGQASAWNAKLVEDAAAIAAEEAARAGFHWTFAPMMDVTRDPRWGRIAEGFGEDPWLASFLSAAMVKGFQGDDLSASNTIAACAKHFVGYGAAEGGRDYDTAIIPEYLLREIYLPPFKASVDVGAATVMTSFNEINGVPASGNKRLVREILKDEWKFPGVVVSDWRSMEEMIAHGYSEDLPDVAQQSIEAGVDMEMQSDAYTDHLAKLVKDGKVDVALIDGAVRRILQLKFDLGLFKKVSPYKTEAHRPPSKKALQIAKQSALESMVLLENDGILPLESNMKSIAVIGPMADDGYEMLGTWNRDGIPEESVTPLAAIRKHDAKKRSIHYAQGLTHSRDKSTSGFPAAVEAAKKSDVVLLFVGEEAILSGEAHSRAYLDLPGAQSALIDAIAETGKPIALVIMAGRPLVFQAFKEKVNAILYGWHPGTMGGPAVSDLLFGVESPSGKLTITFPKAEGQIPVYYARKNTGRPPQARKLTMMDDIPVRAYQSSLGDAARYLDIGYKPAYSFGFGLSYTSFTYESLQLSAASLSKGENIMVSATIRNSGKTAAKEVVQLYVRDRVGSLTRPLRQLKGYQKIHLKPGESKQVKFQLKAAELGFFHPQKGYVVEPGMFDVWIAPNSDEGVHGEFKIVN
ncbi:MAG: glycoside hydrolase family 3 N-terminal domain-containing protein [Calditrichia bacterium]